MSHVMHPLDLRALSSDGILMSNLVIVGAQWGDEGKGKIVDLLAPSFDMVVRYQGGHNAGHTIWIGGKKTVLHLIPSGILHAGKTCLIGNGVVFDLQAFWEEADLLSSLGVELTGRLFVSGQTHLILPCHRLQDRLEEERRGGNKIGTTSRGIGPAYEDKTGRRGLRVEDLMSLDRFRGRLEALLEHKQRTLGCGAEIDELNAEAVFQKLRPLAERLQPFVVDGPRLVNEAIDRGQRILLEGAQGTLLDIDQGTFPYVTSSTTWASGACVGAGISPRFLHRALGIAKAYCTRVGAGPFPTELPGQKGEVIRQKGDEYGASTGRPRRCGWFDAVAMRFSQMLNRFDGLAITKLDVLDEMEEIPICIAYEYRGTQLKHFPSDTTILEQCRPIYEVRPGWQANTQGIREFSLLPPMAQDYIHHLEELIGTNIAFISTGPDRHDTIHHKDIFSR
jgi:adenylosuccinate synthase